MSERSAVQQPMINYAQEIGWEYVTPQQALTWRKGDTELFFPDILTAQLKRLNPNVVDDVQAAEIIRQLNLLDGNIEGNRKMLTWVRGEQSIFVTEENCERNVCLIDFENPKQNVYHVTDEWRHKEAFDANRADVVFLINGIPVAIAETKNAGKPGGLAEGVDQIRRYHQETPRLCLAPQLFDVTELINFFYGVTWSTNRKNIFNWHDEEEGNYERKVKAFFDHTRLLKVLRDYIIFLSRDDQLSKMLLRQHQTRAVEKALERVQDQAKRRGLIWHTQGSGKTLTMITIAAKLLRDVGDGEKPTVLMIVDRNELEAQLFRNISGYGIGNVQVAESKVDLRRLFKEDYRGLIVSMIHKFDDIPANINTRQNIAVLIDEAHRTTGGDLGNFLLAALPNATYIGFTGTPIDRISKGKGTFKVFGGDDERGYLDKYSITESIADGTTVPLHYALAPSELQVDRATLDREFLDLVESEGVSDVKEIDAILTKAVQLREMMKNTLRIERIAEFVADHFRQKIEPMGFKAFLVAVDREACALYKQALDQYLPAAYSSVVISASHNDPPLLKQYHLSAEQEKEVRKNFARQESNLKILIVTEKLLTGFDAPILYTLYLDKPMRDHVLLQTIARVNRPYEDNSGQVKSYGFVLDFVGIFENLSKALSFDADVVDTAIQNIDVLKNLFANLMKNDATAYLPYTQGWDDKAKETSINHFADKEAREKFFALVKKLQNLYDILSPDKDLQPFIKEYQALVTLYTLIRSAYDPKPYIDRELTTKTRRLIREHSSSGYITAPNEIYELGAETLAALRQSGSSDNVKILNLYKILKTTVDQEIAAKPFLTSIGERADSLRQAYEERQATTQQTLAALTTLAEEYIHASESQHALGLDDNTFAIYTALQPDIATMDTDLAKSINGIIEQFPNYRWSRDDDAKLRAELYKLLYPIVGNKNLMTVTNKVLEIQRV